MSNAGDVSKELQVAIRIDPSMADRAEALVAPMAVEYPAFRMTRSAVLRLAMIEGLALLEQKHGPQKAKPKR